MNQLPEFQNFLATLPDGCSLPFFAPIIKIINLLLTNDQSMQFCFHGHLKDSKQLVGI